MILEIRYLLLTNVIEKLLLDFKIMLFIDIRNVNTINYIKF
jgi:hypothetical protein